jgi:hypothetical protein
VIGWKGGRGSDERGYRGVEKGSGGREGVEGVM